MKVLHVITALNVGGAETMLAKLLECDGGAANGIAHEVLSLMRPGSMAARIERTGTPLGTLDMIRAVPLPSHMARLRRAVRASRPDIVMGWMYHGQLAATAAAAMAPAHPPVIWNVRHSLDTIRQEKRATRLILRLGALLSRAPRAIIYNSKASARHYRAIGFSDARAIVIPNGFDCDLFRPDPEARERLRRMFGIDRRAMIVGMIARAHPMKDPATLVEAVHRARQAGADIHLLIAGTGMDAPPPPLAEALAMLPSDRLTLLGHRTDMAALLPGLDVLALPSAWGEGFPNIVGEAMASGVPCVATDVGDSGWIIGDTGFTVPPRDPGAMAQALLSLARMGADARASLGAAARARIEKHFPLSRVAADYADVCRDVMARRRRAETTLLDDAARAT